MQRTIGEMHEEGLLIDEVTIAGDASVCLVIRARIVIGTISITTPMNSGVLKVLRG